MMRKRTIYLLFLNAGNEITEHSPASRQTVRQSSEGVHCRQMNGTWHSKDNGEFTYYKYGYKGDSLKVPKREIFATELFILSDLIWVEDLRNEPKKPVV